MSDKGPQSQAKKPKGRSPFKSVHFIFTFRSQYKEKLTIVVG